MSFYAFGPFHACLYECIAFGAHTHQCIAIFIMHCYICICSILLQFMPRPGSSQVSSAAASDVEMEGSIEQQHMLSRARRRRPPEDHADHEWKRQKDSGSTGQHSSAIDEIG